MRENSTIQQDREVGRRDCEANKYKKTKKKKQKKKQSAGRKSVRRQEERETESESHRLEQRCCPPLAGHPVSLPAAPAG